MERTVFVSVITPNNTEEQVTEYLDELQFLAETAGVVGEKRFVQRVDRPNSKTYIGSGKLEEIKAYIVENEIKLVIFDDELTPSQLRNLERELECRILDRTNLILDIFAQRAKTAYAKTQVELAQYQYLLPRLTRMWTHLERQRGGIGMRGPGESQIETDRRIILDKISRLKEQLKKIIHFVSVTASQVASKSASVGKDAPETKQEENVEKLKEALDNNSDLQGVDVGTDVPAAGDADWGADGW